MHGWIWALGQPAEKALGNQDANLSSCCNVFPMLSITSVLPVDKETIVKGPRFIFTEKAKRINLEPRGNNLITGTRVGESQTPCQGREA